METSPLLRKTQEKYLTAFLSGFFILLLVIAPIIIYTKGYYTYYGDYNSQQIPFYTHAHEFVKTEGVGWDWNTDLGANFIGSYSFYLFGSPFFWLTYILPKGTVVFAMPLLLALKHGIASLTAYAYIRRFVRNKNAAVIGGLLYAFSGFQLFNIFFNHFQDVTAFFPLMLIALEEYINNGRKGVFALSVALMGIINYFFFTGQAVFIILYIIARLGSSDFKITWKKFFGLAFEAVIGVMIAMAILLPSALAILGNYRINERLYGLDLVTYSDRTRLMRIVQSFFMIPDVPARPNLFSTDSGKWSSIGGYLPLFSMAGVIAFAKSRKKHWSKRIVLICAVCAFIPILNSAFYTFNSSYYARWFYMPILIMAVMTAQALDDRSVSFRGGIKVCGGVMLALALISVLPKKNDDEVEWFEFANYPAYFVLVLAVSIAGLVLLFFIDKKRRKGAAYLKTAFYATAASCFICTGTVIYFGLALGPYPDIYINNGINGSENISLEGEEDQLFRVDISENYDNYPMFWGYSNMRAFQSIVPGSIMNFYSNIGVQRDVASRAPLDNYTIRGLFSVKYYFDKVYKDKEDEYGYTVELPGFEYIDTQNGFYIYENKHYVPMGFTFDSYIPDTSADKISDASREKLLMRALILTEEQTDKYSDIINRLDSSDTVGLTDQTYLADCDERRAESCSEFIYDSEGFDAKIALDSPKLVFFSVPYDKGWTAYVNGKPADIEQVSYGFMAVKADKGENTITFRYFTPGLKTGLIISASGAVLLIIYLAASGRRNKRSAGFSHCYDYDSEPIEIQKNYENRF